jgi:peptide/nickel transport system permease protein
MLAFLLSRVLQAAGVLVTVGLIAFAVVRSAGDPVSQMVGPDTPPAERAAIRRSLGLDDPVPAQAMRYLGQAARFDFGASYRLRQPVADLLKERLPATLELALCATLLGLGLGVPTGVFAAVKPDAGAARLFQALSLVGVSLPTFLIGLLLIWAFAVTLGWLPSFGRGATVRLGPWTTGLLTASGRKALVLPALTLALYQTTLLMRLTRAGMLEALRADFIRFARARGLPPRALYLGHALKNAALPVIAVAGLQLGQVIAFAFVTETVFQWPGLGLLFWQAVRAADGPIMAAVLLLVGLTFVALNLVVDILQAALDPRLRRPVAP